MRGKQASQRGRSQEPNFPSSETDDSCRSSPQSLSDAGSWLQSIWRRCAHVAQAGWAPDAAPARLEDAQFICFPTQRQAHGPADHTIGMGGVRCLVMPSTKNNKYPAEKIHAVSWSSLTLATSTDKLSSVDAVQLRVTGVFCYCASPPPCLLHAFPEFPDTNR